MATSYSISEPVAGGILTGTAPSAGAPITYQLDFGDSMAIFGPQIVSGLTAAQLQIRVLPQTTTINGIPTSFVEVNGQEIAVRTESVSSYIAALPNALRQVNSGIATGVQVTARLGNPLAAPASPPPATTPALGATGIRAIAPQLQAAALSAPQTPPVNTPAPVTAPPTVVDPNVVELPEVVVQGTRVESLIQGNGITGERQRLAAQATAQDQADFPAAKDWRVRLALAPGANYLYKANPGLVAGQGGPGILSPLGDTDGVIFPYTPQITVQYAANYNPQDIIHSNYKVYQYQNSSIEAVTIAGTFTCQDVFEAKYLLAVIHFFRSMTKMFYGQDNNPKNGTPPPLCYIYGLGGYQFDALPLAITGFTYTLPTDVDYIPTTGASLAGTPQPTLPNNNTNRSANFLSGAARLLGIGVGPGGTPRPPTYPSTPASINAETTWVPTKIELQINCYPMMSRNMVSNKFSLAEYGTGALLRGSVNPGGGMW
jgi:hypothetical protein